MPAGHYTIIVDFGKGVIVTRETQRIIQRDSGIAYRTDGFGRLFFRRLGTIYEVQTKSLESTSFDVSTKPLIRLARFPSHRSNVRCYLAFHVRQ